MYYRRDIKVFQKKLGTLGLIYFSNFNINFAQDWTLPIPITRNPTLTFIQVTLTFIQVTLKLHVFCDSAVVTEF